MFMTCATESTDLLNFSSLHQPRQGKSLSRKSCSNLWVPKIHTLVSISMTASLSFHSGRETYCPALFSWLFVYSLQFRKVSGLFVHVFFWQLAFLPQVFFLFCQTRLVCCRDAYMMVMISKFERKRNRSSIQKTAGVWHYIHDFAARSVRQWNILL